MRKKKQTSPQTSYKEISQSLNSLTYTGQSGLEEHPFWDMEGVVMWLDSCLI